MRLQASRLECKLEGFHSVAGGFWAGPCGSRGEKPEQARLIRQECWAQPTQVGKHTTPTALSV